MSRRVMAFPCGARVRFVADQREDLEDAWQAAKLMELSRTARRYIRGSQVGWWEFSVTAATTVDAWALAVMLETTDEYVVSRKMPQTP